jgi:hypothetical protein
VEVLVTDYGQWTVDNGQWSEVHGRKEYMDFLKKLFSGSPAKPQKRYYAFSVKCLRCGEIIEGRVDLDNDLSVEYESNRDVYYARKVLMGDNKCFQRMEVELKFTSTRELLEQHVTGGEFC